MFNSKNLNKIFRIIGLFLLGQGSSQIIQVLTGFFLLRWLTLESYGQYGIAFGFQSTLNNIVDIGLSTSIVALVGQKFNDPYVIGNYIRAARYLRTRMTVFLMPLAAVLFYYLTRNLNWHIFNFLVLFTLITLSIYFSGMQSYYLSAIILSKNLSVYYHIQIMSSLLRLGLCFALHEIGVINAVWVCSVNLLTAVISSFYIKYKASSIFFEPAKPSKDIEKTMMSYVIPKIPGILFFALQGQISIFLITVFSGKIGPIAQVSALSRIGQIFILASSFNGIILEPWVARMQRELLISRYIYVIILNIPLLIVFLLIGFIYPEVILFVLGKNYDNLQSEVSWTCLSYSLFYLSGITSAFVSARKLIYWETTIINIVIILAMQIWFIIYVGVSNTLLAVQFGLATTAAQLAGIILNLAYGLKRGPRQIVS